jgi:hypothetical protein
MKETGRSFAGLRLEFRFIKPWERDIQCLSGGRENSCERGLASRRRVLSVTTHAKIREARKILKYRVLEFYSWPTNELKILVSVVRFRPGPPRFVLQRSQPMRLVSLFSGFKSLCVRSISGLLLSSESVPHFSPCQCALSAGRVRQSMFRTDTTGTPVRNNGLPPLP